MGFGSRSETTLAFKMEGVPELQSVAALLHEIAGALGEVNAGGGAGGGGWRNSGGMPLTPNYNAPSSVPANVAGPNGPSAAALGLQAGSPMMGFAPPPAPGGGGNGNASFFAPAGGSLSGNVTINISGPTTINISGPVNMNGAGGGVPGAGGTPAGSGGFSIPGASGPGWGFLQNGGGISSLIGMATGGGGYQAASYATHMAGSFIESQWSGRGTGTELAEQAFESIPVAGWLATPILRPLFDRLREMTALSSVADRAGMRSRFSDAFFDKRYLGSSKYMWAMLGQRTSTSLDYAYDQFSKGLSPNTDAQNYIDDVANGNGTGLPPSPRMAQDAARAFARANEGAGRYGMDSLSPSEMADFLLSSEDYQGALATGSLSDSQRTRGYRRRRNQLLSTHTMATLASSAGIYSAEGGVYGARGDFRSAASSMRARGGLLSESAGAYGVLIDEAQEQYDSATTPESRLVAGRVLKQYQEQAAQARAGASMAFIEADKTYLGGIGATISTFGDIAGSQISALSSTGQVYGPQMARAFARQQGAANASLGLANSEVAYYTAVYGADSLLTQDAARRAAAAGAVAAGLPFQQIEQKYSGYGALAGAAGSMASGGASMASLSGAGTAGTMPFLLLNLLASQTGAGLAVGKLRENIAAGAGPEIIAGGQAAATGAALQALQAQMALSDVTMPASFNIEQMQSSGRLRRMQMSMFEPGNMMDEYKRLYRLSGQRMSAIDSQEQDLARRGLLNPGMRERLERQREDAKMEQFGYQVSMEDGWIDRLVSMSIGAPSFYSRMRPTAEQGAWQLEMQSNPMFRQHRAFGFVTDRGYRADRERGFSTAGMGNSDLYPGDIGMMAGMGRNGVPGGGGLSDGAPDMGSKIDETNQLLQQILSLIASGSMSGAATFGGMDANRATISVQFAPGVGDVRGMGAY